MRLHCLAFCAALALAAPAHAREMSGERALIAVTRWGPEIPIGHVVVTPDDPRARFDGPGIRERSNGASATSAFAEPGRECGAARHPI